MRKYIIVFLVGGLIALITLPYSAPIVLNLILWMI